MVPPALTMLSAQANRLRKAALLRIQYASDIHLEFRNDVSGPALLKPVAPVLALAGDIGDPRRRDYRDFLAYCSRSWDAVFFVAGNHEFYAKRPVAQTLATLRDHAAAFHNVHFLERGRVDYDGVAFLGCTLWTDTTATMRDYRMITTWHRRDRAWLTDAIANCKHTGTPAVVLTHHLPSYAFVASRYATSPINFCFASRCDDLLQPPVRAWIAGHTHAAVHRHWTFDGGEVVHGCVNPMGYPGETDTAYCREIFVDVSTEAVNDIVFERGGDPLLVAATATEEEDFQ